MNIATYLYLHVVGGAVIVVAAILLALKSALSKTGWPAQERATALRRSAFTLIGWFAIACALSWVGAFGVNREQIPTIELGILPPILLGGYFIWRAPQLSELLDAVPAQWLVGVQFYRVLGGIFLLLCSVGKLPSVFALPAGLGDVTVGLFAPFVAYRYAHNPVKNAWMVRAWNIFGIVDLVVALSTGFLTSPSPIQMFAFDAPNSLISAFPLVLVPTYLVPLAILLHIASLRSLRNRQPVLSSPGSAHREDPEANGEYQEGIAR